MEITMSEAPGGNVYLKASPFLILGLFSVTQWLAALQFSPAVSTSLLERELQSTGCNTVAITVYKQ